MKRSIKQPPATQSVLIRRHVRVPDPVKATRYARSPELGPKLLFFSGGTALKRTCKSLIQYTHHSCHIITAFDSGGSSAQIRKAFSMLSIGDLRNRLMALADQTVKGNPSIYELFSYRLSADQPSGMLLKKLESIARGHDSLVDGIPTPMRDIICNHLQHFLTIMPDDFDLRGANIGNLILTAGYLMNHRQIDTVLYLFSRLIEARGQVRPVITENLHIGCELKNGAVAIGQHIITGGFPREQKSPVRKLFLSASGDSRQPVDAEINTATVACIRQAEVICYPMGSFFTSVAANLLPRGVASAVTANLCPKIYIPNTLADDEQFGMNLGDAVEMLADCLNQNSRPADPREYINLILIDSAQAKYPYDLELDRIRLMGIDVLDTQLVTPHSFPYIDPERLCRVLLSFT
ncbi:MAG TPA: GAK system CofD-like protein [Syntrophaceae bacterium]|nr:GAK system CofD-like protein [Syntrophaceae bacterium]HCX01495.1 GAK system CofD-like protein [Syntrophaceae bacterium]